MEKLKKFSRENNVRILAKKRVDSEKVNSIFESLKKQREILKINAGDKDLQIISIYKAENIDCIISINSFHFEPFCKYLHIEFEKPLKDSDVLLRKIFGWKRKKY